MEQTLPQLHSKQISVGGSRPYVLIEIGDGANESCIGAELNRFIEASDQNLFLVSRSGVCPEHFIERSVKTLAKSQDTKLVVCKVQGEHVFFRKDAWKAIGRFSEDIAKIEVISEFVKRAKHLRKFVIVEILAEPKSSLKRP